MSCSVALRYEATAFGYRALAQLSSAGVLSSMWLKCRIREDGSMDDFTRITRMKSKQEQTCSRRLVAYSQGSIISHLVALKAALPIYWLTCGSSVLHSTFTSC